MPGHEVERTRTRVQAPLGDQLVLSLVDPADQRARACLTAYYDELAHRFARGFDPALSRDPDKAEISPPRGAFFIAEIAGAPMGCVALRRTGYAAGEIKRLWVSPSSRGQGVGRQLMAVAEHYARQLGLQTLRLDTNNALPEAAALYQRAGWLEIERFNDDPYADRFFEKRLSLVG